MEARYKRQIMAEEFGEEAQCLLSSASVLIVGAGGLGVPAASYLAAAGIGIVGIVDDDRVEESNLNRQLSYCENEIGEYKAQLLAKKLQIQNPHIKVKAHQLRVTKENALNLLSNYDIVCDCTDSIQSRICLDETCARLSKPLVYAGVKDWEGFVSVLHYQQKVAFKDLFVDDDLIVPTAPSDNSVINTTCGIAGNLQATEVLKIITQQNGILDGSILCFNTMYHTYRTFKINGSSV